MSILTTHKGHILLEFRMGSSPEIPDDEMHIPLPLALVAAKYQGKWLFIFNTWRKEWELPGGMVEEGETPEQAAAREFTEETGQLAPPLQYMGLAKMQLKPDDRLEFAALYACELSELRPFTAHDEADEMVFWDLQTPLQGAISEIDHKLVELIQGKLEQP